MYGGRALQLGGLGFGRSTKKPALRYPRTEEIPLIIAFCLGTVFFSYVLYCTTKTEKCQMDVFEIFLANSMAYRTVTYQRMLVKPFLNNGSFIAKAAKKQYTP